MKHILFVLVFLIGCSSTEQYSTTTSPLINKSLELCMLNDGYIIYIMVYILLNMKNVDGVVMNKFQLESIFILDIQYAIMVQNLMLKL